MKKPVRPVDVVSWVLAGVVAALAGGSLILMAKGCTPSRCTSHPYDPKAACASPAAQLGPRDGGP